MKADRDLMLAKTRAVFPDRDPETVLTELERYGSTLSARMRNRVLLAIVKLTDEMPAPDLEKAVALAERDHRDVIAWAETPETMHSRAALGTSERARLAEANRRQYEAWLRET
ncbi:MAG TPA: hypothetical protein VLL72_11870 [Kiloniellales bacterium]|nr:hypothetical protein [Kiloniellales bacterium]